GNSGKSEAEVEAPARRRAPEAVRRLAAGAAVAPAAAPEHPARAHRGRSPLRHIALHVAQAQFIRRGRANPRWTSEILFIRRGAERIVAVEVGLIGGEVVARLGEEKVIRTFFHRSGPAPTCTFPLRFRRQAVQIATRSLFFIQLLDELLG